MKGWEPKRTTTVVEWDDQGRPAKWVTELEPEYDVHELDDQYALEEYNDALCPQCGQLRSICSDPDTAHYPQLHVCWATAAQTVASRRFHRLHEKAEPDASGYLPTDGALVWVADEDLTPDDDFLMDALPVSPTQRADTDEDET